MWVIIFFLSKADFKFFAFSSIYAAMEFFQIKIIIGIVGSYKCNVIVVFCSKFWMKYFCRTVIYDREFKNLKKDAI